jgi:hypothetical protein
VVYFGKTLRVHRLPDPPAEIGEGIHVFEAQVAIAFLHKIKPVATPRDIARHGAVAGHLDGESRLRAIAGDIRYRDFAVRMQRGGDDAHRRFQPMLARFDSTQVRQRHDDSDGPVTAHAEIAHVVEEDDARGTGRVRRGA